MIPEEKINSINDEYESLRLRVSDPSEMNDQRAYKKLSRRFNELQNIVTAFQKLEKNKEQLTHAKDLIYNETDQELVALAKEEFNILEIENEKLTNELKELLIPKDPNDDKNVIIEIRAGTGGEEAALFVADLYRMYGRYAELNSWKKAVISFNETGRGGFKEIVFSLEGENVYGTMRFESGVHRVQRVPVTEASGRIHTSAITVAVLPEADEIDLQISENDLKIDVHKSQGCGGQSVNTTESAVRITHLPTGLVQTCQDEKSQIKNREKALTLLRARLLDLEISKQEAEVASNRKAQVGTGDRSGKIRTYNFPQSRITDHRVNLTSYNLSGFLDGDIVEFIEALKLAYKNERLSS